MAKIKSTKRVILSAIVVLLLTNPITHSQASQSTLCSPSYIKSLDRVPTRRHVCKNRSIPRYFPSWNGDEIRVPSTMGITIGSEGKKQGKQSRFYGLLSTARLVTVDEAKKSEDN